MKHNYHSHTVRCGHAVGTEREYIENGIKNGLITIGFSDHSPYTFWKGRDGGLEVNRELASDYFRTLGLLRQEYRELIPESVFRSASSWNIFRKFSNPHFRSLIPAQRFLIPANA